ncbi:AraC family transcriptional regulator [Gramella sp. KN1008]|uniref:helix-turn-helix domain-containing protein n=1 Tax=Gramella sp. KN1008 TaxID=2529298 RepID=UPI00103A39B3|nr:AraC family transcriptional regulator [Gramella sp. KN1008]TBW26412.1 AraC family transcriptional regulator [Gramella sp. KN1008]
MKTYHLELNDVDDFIPEFAKKLGSDYTEHLGEYNFKIPHKNGDGNIRGINFPNGVGLYTYHCKFLENLQLKISLPSINPIRFLYCIEGEIDSFFDNNEDFTTIENHQFLISAPKDSETHNIILKKDTAIVLCYLEIDRLKFQQYFSFDLNELEPVFYKVFSDVKAKHRICKTGSYSLKTAETIKEIKNCELEGFPRINFIGAKSLEILSYMLTRFKKEKQIFQSKTLKQRDMKALEKVVEYLDHNIAKVGTVNDLAKIAGMNSNKLQEAFQLIYGKTVNEYIRDIRLTKALNMLSAGNRNVSEVVYELGLSSRSYFSKIFKAKYGISPRKILASKSRSKLKT